MWVPWCCSNISMAMPAAVRDLRPPGTQTQLSHNIASAVYNKEFKVSKLVEIPNAPEFPHGVDYIIYNQIP